MTTPNDITDLMKALDRNPELDAALPQRLLIQDLLELPNNVAQLTDAVAEMTRVFDQRLTALDSRFDTAHAGGRHNFRVGIHFPDAHQSVL